MITDGKMELTINKAIRYPFIPPVDDDDPEVRSSLFRKHFESCLEKILKNPRIKYSECAAHFIPLWMVRFYICRRGSTIWLSKSDQNTNLLLDQDGKFVHDDCYIKDMLLWYIDAVDYALINDMSFSDYMRSYLRDGLKYPVDYGDFIGTIRHDDGKSLINQQYKYDTSQITDQDFDEMVEIVNALHQSAICDRL